MESTSYLDSVNSCPKSIPRPKVKQYQVDPAPAEARVDSSGKEAICLATISPPPYQYGDSGYSETPVYAGRHQNTNQPASNKTGCCDLKCAIITCLLILLSLAALTITTLVIFYKPNTNDDTTTTSLPTTPPPGWTEWSSWSECDVTCGGGYRSRSRTCNTDETLCTGPYNQTEMCATSRCPLPEYGSWSSWSSWGECTETCGGGIQVRSRVCDQEPHQLACPGQPEHDRECNSWDCPSCSRTCPDGGAVKTPMCTECSCTSNTDLTGKVTDQNNLPLEGVRVVDAYWPGVHLTSSDADGEFIIRDPCNGIQLELHKANYVTTTLTIGNSTLVKMDKVEPLSVIKDPKNRQRLLGESVTFCCEITGKPHPDYVEWFHDGGVVESIPFTGNATFTIDNVTNSHEGFYRCRANNDYSSVYSENARLTIKDSSSGFCSGDPSPNLISLPPGCSLDGQTTVDTGYCAPTPCRQSGAHPESCWEDHTSCCGPTDYFYMEVDCQSFTLPVRAVKSCGCTSCPVRAINIVGRVTSAYDRSPVKFADVTVNSTLIAKTDANGDFQVSLPSGTRMASITIKDSSFNKLVETSKVMHFPEGADATYYVYIKMMPVKESSVFKADTGAAFLLGRQSSPFGAIFIPPSRYFTLNGEPVTDNIRAQVSFIDPSNLTDVQSAPGDLSFVDSDGNRQLLQTNGMFSLNFVSEATQETLQLSDRVIVVMDSSKVNLNRAIPRLWSLNKNTGSWKDEGQLSNDTTAMSHHIPARFHPYLSLFSDYLVGGESISVDYTWSNFDYQSELACHSKVRVFEDNYFSKESQLDGIQIEVLVEENGEYSASDIRAFSDGGMDTNGYCVVHLCERVSGTADYSALLIGYEGNDPNENRLRPALRNNSGIDSKTMDAIEYQAIDTVGDGAISFKPRLHAVGKKGPLYDWDGVDKGIKDWAYSEACSTAKFESDNHFRMYAIDKKDPCSYENNVLTQPNCALENPNTNLLAWYAQAHDEKYYVCYIKVLVDHGKDTRFQALSRMSISGRDITPYGVRQGCSTKSRNSAICLEVKYAGPVTNCDSSTDEDDVLTLLQMSQVVEEDTKDTCKRTALNSNLTLLYGDDLKDLENKNLFQMHFRMTDYGSDFGIYCNQQRGSEASLQKTKQDALSRCMAGIDKPYQRMPKESNEDNWAVMFSCSKKDE